MCNATNNVHLKQSIIDHVVAVKKTPSKCLKKVNGPQNAVVYMI